MPILIIIYRKEDLLVLGVFELGGDSLPRVVHAALHSPLHYPWYAD